MRQREWAAALIGVYNPGAMPPDPTTGSLTIADVRAAATRIEGRVLRTPVLRHAVGGVELLCKAESLQPTGAFKLRGAFNLMTTLPPDTQGVVAHSSGNHAQAVAWAARALGLTAVIVLPDDAPTVKRERTEALGAKIITVGSDSDERVRRAEELVQTRNLIPVPPYDHLLVAAGQGTAALELVEEAGPLQRFYAPVRGGGLMAGWALTRLRLVLEPSGAASLAVALREAETNGAPPPGEQSDPGAPRWGVLLSGGNVDRSLLASALESFAS